MSNPAAWGLLLFCDEKVLWLVWGDRSFPYQGVQEVLFAAWSNEFEAVLCLLLPEHITHLIFSVLAERQRLGELNPFNPPSSNHISFYMTALGMQGFLKAAESIGAH